MTITKGQYESRAQKYFIKLHSNDRIIEDAVPEVSTTTYDLFSLRTSIRND